MIHGSMKHYASGRKKKYDAWKPVKKVEREFVEYKPTSTFRRSGTDHIPSLSTSGHVPTATVRHEYTGTLIKGISTMHKSNAVPVISEEEMKDHARMRR